MNERGAGLRHEIGNWAGSALGRLEVLALFPLVALTASWFGFTDLAMITALGLSALLAIAVLLGRNTPRGDLVIASGGTGRAGLTALLEQATNLEGRDTACFLVQIDDWPVLVDRWGHDSCQDLVNRTEDRLRAALRHGDVLVRLGDARFGIGLAPIRSARLEWRETIAARLAQSVGDPIPFNGTTLHLTACVGHTALIRRGADPAAATFLAAEAALSDAVAHAPNAVRAYAPNLGRARSLQSSLSADVEGAIHAGSITAWFQPQICAKTGAILGMETLARWDHPKQGLLSTGEFLGAVSAAGHLPLLGQSLTHQALKALSQWDAAPAHIPSVSINISAPELRDGSMVSGLVQELSRYALDPARVRIEIAEDVAASAEDDAIIASLIALKEAGHLIDLDGFGLGATSVPMLQRFRVDRIKIDRAFVVGVDGDAANASSVSAIVAMAQALGISTLANGVETPNERTALEELGCDALQGFGIAGPMRSDKVADWARARLAKDKTIRLDDRRSGS